MELEISGEPAFQRREHVAVELWVWGIGLAESRYGDTEVRGNTLIIPTRVSALTQRSTHTTT
jgi:hypothetical protein